jgi:hypothetical protein
MSISEVIKFENEVFKQVHLRGRKSYFMYYEPIPVELPLICPDLVIDIDEFGNDFERWGMANFAYCIKPVFNFYVYNQ